MKQPIVIVGPIAPFRGGIAQYNTELLRALNAGNTTPAVCISFERQYPAWLYPGQSDLDPALAGHKEERTLYLLDSTSIGSWHSCAAEIIKMQPRAVLFHWWTVFFLPSFVYIAVMLRRRRIPVGLICHNLTDHDASWIKKRISNLMPRLADGFVVHSREHQVVLASSWPQKPITRYPIPTYSSFPRPLGALPRRGRLELLFFGFIRPYKGLDVLLAALAQLDDREIFLTVVGEHWAEKDALHAQAAEVPNVELHLEYCADKDVSEFFARADMVVLPYRSATGSAVASVATAFCRPILATRVGGLPDVVEDGVTGILVPPSDSRAIAEAIRTIDRRQTSQMSQRIANSSDGSNWEAAALQIKALCDAMTSSGN